MRRGRACGENVMVTEHGTTPPRAVLVTEVGPLVELQQYGGREMHPTAGQLSGRNSAESSRFAKSVTYLHHRYVRRAA